MPVTLTSQNVFSSLTGCCLERQAEIPFQRWAVERGAGHLVIDHHVKKRKKKRKERKMNDCYFNIIEGVLFPGQLLS